MPATDWNIRLVNAREAQRMLPRKPDTDDEVDWRGVEIALLDTGYTTHPVFGPWVGGSSPVLQVARAGISSTLIRRLIRLTIPASPATAPALAAFYAAICRGSWSGLRRVSQRPPTA